MHICAYLCIFRGVLMQDIKNRLQQYKFLKIEVDQLAANINMVDTQFGAVDVSGVSSLYMERLNEMLVELDYLERVIRNVPDSRDRLILQKRYVEGKTWEVICVEMNYCYRQICRVHSKIIQDLRHLNI